MPEQLNPPEKKDTWLARIGWFGVLYVVLLVVCLPFILLAQPRSKLEWLILVLFAPPAYLLLEWAGGRIAEPWGESTALRKALKAGCLVLGYLAFTMVWLLFAPASCS